MTGFSAKPGEPNRQGGTNWLHLAANDAARLPFPSDDGKVVPFMPRGRALGGTLAAGPAPREAQSRRWRANLPLVAGLVLSLMAHAALLLLVEREPEPMTSLGEVSISVELVLGTENPAGLAQNKGENEVQQSAGAEQPREPEREEQQAQEPAQTKSAEHGQDQLEHPDRRIAEVARDLDLQESTEPKREEPARDEPQQQALVEQSEEPEAKREEPAREEPQQQALVEQPKEPEAKREEPAREEPQQQASVEQPKEPEVKREELKPEPPDDATPKQPSPKQPKRAPEHNNAARQAERKTAALERGEASRKEARQGREKKTERNRNASAASNAANGVGQGRSAANSNYNGLVAAHLARFKQFPADARARGDGGSAAVSFRLDGSGRVLSVSLVRPSGVASLDQEATSMVRRASPFPAPPDGRPQSFSVPVSFRLR